MNHAAVPTIRPLKRATGFTFTEILIVLAIIAGVTVLVLSQADTAVGSSEVSETAGIVRSFVTAAHQYRSLTGSYEGINTTALGDLQFLPASAYDAATDSTIIPYNNINGVAIYETPSANGRSYYISLDLGVATDNLPVMRQLHESFGGYENAKLGVPPAHAASVALSNATAANLVDSRYWARTFD